MNIPNPTLQNEFRQFLSNKLSNPKDISKIKSDLVYYLASFFVDFTDAEIKAICLEKSDKGASESGQDVLVNPQMAKKEKLMEVVDLINYSIMEEFQNR